MGRHIKDLTGMRFGRLIAKSPTYLRQRRTPIWECLCDCGEIVLIPANSLQFGSTQSCGCLRKESTKCRFTIHGETDKKEYRTWANIFTRCANKNTPYFKNYGGRGITVCNEWKKSYPQFLKDVGRAPSKKHSIDRIDNNGNYEPSNVRWATQSEQLYNSRRALRGEQNV